MSFKKVGEASHDEAEKSEAITLPKDSQEGSLISGERGRSVVDFGEFIIQSLDRY